MEFFEVYDLAATTGSKRSVTPQGYLLIEDCKLAKAGVFEYLAANFQPRAFTDRAPTDIVKIYRSKDTIREGAKGFSGAPVTNNHPDEWLDLDNTKLFQKGHVNGAVRVEDGVMLADLLITDKFTLQSINSGKEQLSNGYLSQYTFDGGKSPEGETYDAEQIAFKANHVAIVDQGRNGFECRVSDSYDVIEDQEEKTMAIVKIGGVSYEASEQVVQAVGILQQTSDSATAKVEEFGNVDTRIGEAVTAKSSEMQATIDAQQVTIDKLKKEIPDVTTLEQMVNDRAVLVGKIKVLLPTTDCKGKTDMQLKGEAVLTSCADIKTLDNLDDIYINARFDAMTADTSTETGKKLATALALGEQTTTDSEDDAVEVARQAATERRGKAWERKQ